MGDHFLQSTKYCGFFQDRQTLSHHIRHEKSVKDKYPCETIKLKYDDFVDEEQWPCYHPNHHTGNYKMVQVPQDETEKKHMDETCRSLDEKETNVLDQITN